MRSIHEPEFLTQQDIRNQVLKSAEDAIDIGN